jgi:hypothetical protein
VFFGAVIINLPVRGGISRRNLAAANGVFRPWYVSFQERQRRLAPVDPHPAAGLVDMLLDRGLGQAEPDRDFLVGQEGCEPQTFFLTGAEAQ